MKWRELANHVSTHHESDGVAFVTFDGTEIPDNLSAEDVSPSHLLLPGRSVPPEAIRSALWEWRNAMTAVGANLVWSKWFEDRNVSLVGLGKLVPRRQEAS